MERIPTEKCSFLLQIERDLVCLLLCLTLTLATGMLSGSISMIITVRQDILCGHRFQKHNLPHCSRKQTNSNALSEDPSLKTQPHSQKLNSDCYKSDVVMLSRSRPTCGCPTCVCPFEYVSLKMLITKNVDNKKNAFRLHDVRQLLILLKQHFGLEHVNYCERRLQRSTCVQNNKENISYALSQASTHLIKIISMIDNMSCAANATHLIMSE